MKNVVFSILILSSSLLFCQSNKDRGSLKYATIDMKHPDNGYYSESFKVKYRFVNCYGEVGLNIAIIPESLTENQPRLEYSLNKKNHFIKDSYPNYQYEPKIAFLEIRLHHEEKYYSNLNNYSVGKYLGTKKLGGVNNWDIAGCFGQTYAIIGMINKDEDKNSSIKKIDEEYYLKHLDNLGITVSLYEPIRNGKLESEIKAKLKKKENEKLNQKIDWHINLGDSELNNANDDSKDYYCKKALQEYNKALAFMPSNKKTLSRIKEAKLKCRMGKEEVKKKEKVDDFFDKEKEYSKNKNKKSVNKDFPFNTKPLTKNNKNKIDPFEPTNNSNKKTDGFYTDKEDYKIESLNGKYGVVDKDNNVIIPFKYSSIDSYRNGMARATLELLSEKLSYDNCNHVSLKVIKKGIINEKNKWVLIDEKKVVIEEINFDNAFRVHMVNTPDYTGMTSEEIRRAKRARAERIARNEEKKKREREQARIRSLKCKKIREAEINRLINPFLKQNFELIDKT